MKFVKRVFRALPYLALAALPAATLWAQDSQNLQAYGSGVVLPIVQEIAQAQDLTLALTVTGTDAGFAAFCDGSIALVGATRPISTDENNQCLANEVAYREFLLGHEILTLIANPEGAPFSCLTQEELTRAFAPSSTGTILDWSELVGEAPPEDDEDRLPLVLYAPLPQTLVYAQLDALVIGDGLRRDAALQSFEQIIDAVASDPGALGVISLESALRAEDRIFILAFDDGMGCFVPSAENVENRLYSPANRLFVYVKEENVSDLTPLLEALSSEETAGEIVRAAGITPPTALAYEQNALAARGEIGPGRLFSQDITGFEIPDVLVGEVRTGGAANAHTWARRVADSLRSQQANLTISFQFEGEAAGIRRLCNGELDFVFATRQELSPEQAAACEANNIRVETLPVGTRATVLIANEEDTFALCLTTGQIRSLWSAESTNTLTNWNQLGEAFPELPITLFGYNGSDVTTDLLFHGGGPALPARQDTEVSFDPLYRAAATANVSGALTYMSWQDYLRVQANGQQNIQLVSIDDGRGCVAPSEQSIVQSTYPLTQRVTLFINQASLTDINVQSYLWSLFSDDNGAAAESEGLLGLSFITLPNYRTSLEQLFARAYASLQFSETPADSDEGAADTPAQEATPEATAEAES